MERDDDQQQQNDATRDEQPKSWGTRRGSRNAGWLRYYRGVHDRNTSRQRDVFKFPQSKVTALFEPHIRNIMMSYKKHSHDSTVRKEPYKAGEGPTWTVDSFANTDGGIPVADCIDADLMRLPERLKHEQLQQEWDAIAHHFQPHGGRGR